MRTTKCLTQAINIKLSTGLASTKRIQPREMSNTDRPCRIDDVKTDNFLTCHNSTF